MLSKKSKSNKNMAGKLANLTTFAILIKQNKKEKKFNMSRKSLQNF